MDKKEARKLFYSQDKLPVEGTRESEHFRFYRLLRSCQTVCEVNLSLGLGGEEIELAHITDMHLNHFTAEDFDDGEIMDTIRHREWLKGGEALMAAERAMSASDYADFTVVTGDILDFLSHGSRELAEKYVFSHKANALFCPGLHDYLKEMQTGVPEKLPYEVREKLLKSFWPNDLHYATKVLKDKLLIVAIDNSPSHYLEETYALLKADIERARAAELKLLLFQHEPLCTHDSADTAVLSAAPVNHDAYNFLTGPYINGGPCANETDKKFHKLLLESTDVVKGIFAGHFHSVYYTEVKGENGAFIPQYVSIGCPYYNGALTRIIIR